MTNAVESLFDNVLASLPAEERYENHTIDPEKDRDDDWIDEPPDSSTNDDILTTLEEERLVRRATDGLNDYRRDSERLPSDIREVFEGGVRRRGFDVLAFYKSRRLIAQRPYVGRWGIFYLKHGVTFVANEIERTYPGYSDPRLLAYEFLREHERFHFKADLQTLMLEAVTGRHLHGPRRQAFKGRRNTFVEEALANRQAWDWSKKRSNAIEDFAFDFMKLQPGAYSRFDEPRLSLAAEWTANVIDGNVTKGATRHDFAHWVETLPTGLQRASLCPEYFVRPATLATWLPSAVVLPPVITVTDAAEVTKRLSTRFINLRDQWIRTKEKLIESRFLRGLNFKPWPNDGKACYSVKVDDSFRAHLKHEGGGNWIAYIIGSHKELGHG